MTTAKDSGSSPPGSSRKPCAVAAGTALLALLLVSAVALGALGGVGTVSLTDSQHRAAERVPPPVDRAVQRDDRGQPLPRQSSPRPSTAPAAVPRRQLLWPAGKTDKSPNCGSWADQGECEKNPGFMQSDCAATCSKRPQDTLGRSECVALSERGGCRSRRGAIPTMANTCRGHTCYDYTYMGYACASGASECTFTCLEWLQWTTTPDKEGNCWYTGPPLTPTLTPTPTPTLTPTLSITLTFLSIFTFTRYWSTDGECAANPVWMNNTCPRSCQLLHHCDVTPHGDECSVGAFECPPKRDQDLECPERALRGECRATELWGSASVSVRCSASCHLLDPAAVSHTVTRPGVRRNARVDLPPYRGAAIYRRHSPTHCHMGKQHLHALLSASCPNPRLQPHGGGGGGGRGSAVPWLRHRLRCPRRAPEMTPRLSYTPSPRPGHAASPRLGAPLRPLTSPLRPPAGTPELPASLRERAAAVVVQHVWEAPRVRLLHNFISAEDAQAIIALATPHYHRSSTARAGADESRTSHSAMLSPSHPAVASLRQMIAYFAGYPEHTNPNP